MKQRIGYGPADGPAGMRKNLELIQTVRDVVGPDVELAADAYMGWTVPYAVRMIRQIEDAGLHLAWLEEPVLPDDIAGYAEIARAVDTPISGGEHEFTRYGFRELIDRGAVDIVQLDVNRVGGITEARKIWAMAAGAGLPVLPHAGQLAQLPPDHGPPQLPDRRVLPPPRPARRQHPLLARLLRRTDPHQRLPHPRTPAGSGPDPERRFRLAYRM